MMSVHAHRPPNHFLSSVSQPPLEADRHSHQRHPAAAPPASIAQVNNTVAPPLGTLATLRQELTKGFAAEVGKSVLGAGVLAGSAAAFHSVDRRFLNNTFFNVFKQAKQRESIIEKAAEFKALLSAGLLIKALDKSTESAVDIVNHVVKQKFPKP